MGQVGTGVTGPASEIESTLGTAHTYPLDELSLLELTLVDQTLVELSQDVLR